MPVPFLPHWVVVNVIRSLHRSFSFFAKCRENLTPGGLIVVKDNHTRQSDVFVFDQSDCSLTRSAEHLALLFKMAGLKVVKEEAAKGFPAEIFPVRMWALEADSQ